MSKRTRTAVILATFVLGLAVAGTALGKQLDGRTILKNMLEAEGRAAFTAHQVTSIAWGPAVTSEQIVYRAGFKGMRTEYIAPEALRGEIMADDGRVLAHLIPKAKVLRMCPSRLAHLKMRTEQAAQGFARGNLTIELVGRDKIAGRTAYVVEARPKQRNQGPTRKFWVDTDKWVKLKTEDVRPDGTVASTSYYTKINFTDAIPDRKFKIEPPAGVRVEHEVAQPPPVPIKEAQRQVDFRILEPSYLPPGFKPLGASVVPFRGGKLVAVRYTDGVSSFSLFQTPGRTLDRKFLHRLHKGPVRPDKGVYSWRHGNLNLTIVGQLPPDQISKVASSVK